jgi:UrcA family protein
MYRTLVLASALGALALPAAAATTLKVNIAGLDAKAAHAKIVRAAEMACTTELSDASPYEQVYARTACVRDAVAEAEAKIASAGGDPRLAAR